MSSVVPNSLGSIANATTDSTTSTGSGKKAQTAQEQKNQFLILLTQQLKSQDPLKPYDNQQFAAQLAQFSQLEQLSGIRTLLETQGQSNLSLSNTITNTALPGMLGKIAKAYTENINYAGDGSNLQLGFSIDKPGEAGLMSIYNGDGQVIRHLKVAKSELSSGDHNVNWDGKDDFGRNVPKGTYTYFTDYQDKNGDTFKGKTFNYGTIEAVRFKSDGTMLVIGGLEVPLGNVTDISTRN
ncbi:MAG: hypothetical protein NTW25_06540 [Candidatus Kapabacteria bacterium]|nr:hypothetical protein [Candidatus Kapabacteria bacterium]